MDKIDDLKFFQDKFMTDSLIFTFFLFKITYVIVSFFVILIDFYRDSVVFQRFFILTK